jgi:hypothetical protein
MSPSGIKNSPGDHEQQLSALDDEKQISASAFGGKEAFDEDRVQSAQIKSAQNSRSSFGEVLDSERDIATHVISVHDDPTLNPWTLRAFIIGLGLSAFGGVLGKSFTFVLLSGVEGFGQRRFTTSNQYEVALFLVCRLILITVNSKPYLCQHYF